MKGCFAMFMLILVVVSLGFGAMNWYQVQQMRKEISAVTDRVHVTGPKPGSGKDLVTPLAKTQSHIERARELLRKKKTAAAQDELDKALASLSQANNVSRDMIGDLGVLLGKTRESLTSAYQKALKDISSEIKSQEKGKIDVERK